MINQQIKDYKILALLGEGGMATVYLAEHNLLGNKIAFKLLNNEFLHNDNIRKRFLAEARSMANMSHSSIVKVTDLIDDGDKVAIVMEYVEGVSLKEYIEHKGKLNDDEIKSLFIQMLEALKYVHEKKLVHRDIKPSNFMIDPSGKVKLMDFGIAKTTDTASVEYTQTGTGVQMGTPMYMSPEQITETKSVTPQSDIYSLGVVLWQMVTGDKPYDTKTLSTFQLQMKIVQEELPKTNTKWDAIISQATSKDVHLRFNECNTIIQKIIDVKETEIISIVNYDLKNEFDSSEKTILVNAFNNKIDAIKSFDFPEIKIGDDIWMNKNLSIESFQNGDKLFFARNQTEWIDAVNNKIPAFCFYNFNKDLSLKFGLLYNFYAVYDNRKLSPLGWDLPTNKNWDDLINYFGGEKLAGSKLKCNLNKLWKEPVKTQYSSIKFEAIPAGFINQNGFFKNIGEGAYFWSKDEFNDFTSWNYYLLNFTTSISKTNSSKGIGYSVRCIKL